MVSWNFLSKLLPENNFGDTPQDKTEWCLTKNGQWQRSSVSSVDENRYLLSCRGFIIAWCTLSYVFHTDKNIWYGEWIWWQYFGGDPTLKYTFYRENCIQDLINKLTMYHNMICTPTLIICWLQEKLPDRPLVKVLTQKPI